MIRSVKNLSNETLVLTCYDNDLIGKDFMGHVSIPLRNLMDLPNLSKEKYLLESNSKGSKVSGHLIVSLQFFPKYKIKIGGGEGVLNWKRYQGKSCDSKGTGWEAKFKIMGTKVKGSNKNDDGNSVKKHYKGTYNPTTRDLNLKGFEN